MNSTKVVLITNCSSGFGRLIAENLARKNYHVFATMRGVGAAMRTQSALRALAQRESLHLQVLELDVTDDASVERTVDDIIAQTKRIDLLVNNAGDAVFGLVESPTLKQAKRIINTNFLGVVHINRAVPPYMRPKAAEAPALAAFQTHLQSAREARRNR